MIFSMKWKVVWPTVNFVPKTVKYHNNFGKHLIDRIRLVLQKGYILFI